MKPNKIDKTVPRREHRRKDENFGLALGMGMNWVDMDSGVIYHIQDYKEAKPEMKAKGILMTRVIDGAVLGYAQPEDVEEKMKDPKPDPKY